MDLNKQKYDEENEKKRLLSEILKIVEKHKLTRADIMMTIMSAFYDGSSRPDKIRRYVEEQK